MAEGLRPRTGPEHTQFGTSEREKFPSREVDPSRYKNLVYYDLFGERARNSASYSMFSGYEYNKDGWAARIMKDEIKNLIESYDGKTSGSVSKKTDVVIVGSEPGSKYDKARELGITIWNEEEFLEHLNNE